MSTQEKIEALFQEVVALPDEAQAELVQSLVQFRTQPHGIYHFDHDEREALARSAEDVRLGRFASDAEIEETFSRYGA
jgi:hypothetical protein